MKNALLVLMAAITIAFSSADTCSAEQRLQDSVGVDKFAHFGVSYLINDQLQRNCKMSPFSAALTTLAIGAAKELFIDGHWDNGDFAADAAGVFMYQIRF